MRTLQALKRKLRAAVAPAAFSALAAYFAFNAAVGAHGTAASERLREEIAVARVELGRAEAERDALERRVASLRSGGAIDGDLLEERARVSLNFVDRRDLIIPYGPGRELFLAGSR